MAHVHRRHWLEKALRGSPTFNAAENDGGAHVERKPDFQSIGEQLIFTKDLILTYHAVILSVIVVFSLVHWNRKFQGAWKHRRKVRETGGNSNAYTHEHSFKVHHTRRDGSSSSSSSTLEGDDAPPCKDDRSESDVPLLRSRKPTRPSNNLWNRMKGFMLYQPSRIPFVNKTLPSNATSTFVLGLIGLNMFYLFYCCPLGIKTLFIFADRAGMLFVANLPLLYFLGAKNQPIKFMTGYSYESLNIIHRRLGEILCILALLHTVGMFGVWYTLLRPSGLNLAWFLTRKIILLGLFAFISYETIYLTSLGSFRQKWYELFLVMHVFFQAAALILLWFHHHTTRTYVGLALAIFLIDRLVFRLTLKTRQTKASLTVLEDGQTARVSATWAIPSYGSLHSLIGMTRNYKYGWKPTEHVFLTVPALSRKHMIQAHPFTIASTAPTSPDGQAELSLVIRAQDGFSKDLVKFAKRTTSATVRMDGPYGSQRAMDTLLNSDAAVVVAGGSGIAIAYPLVATFLPQSSITSDTEHGFQPPSTKICLIWITHEASHHSWLGDKKIQHLREAGIHVILPPPTAEAGRPDVAHLVQTWIHEHVGNAMDTIGVICSGPDGMNRAVRNVCAEMVTQGRNVHVDIEKFGW